MTRLLITGGCGFIGVNLIAALLRQDSNLNIRVYDNETLGTHKNLDEFDVEFIHGDIRDLDLLRRSLNDVDSVVHLAADTRVMDSIKNPLFNFEVNVQGTFGLLHAMRDAGVNSIINASTGGAILGEVPPPVHEGMLPEPHSPYGASKLAVEGYLCAFSHAYGFKATSLRFSNVYGPRSYHKGSVVAHFFKQILAGKDLVVYGDGSQTRDYVFVEDLCQGIIQALQSHLSGVFQLGSGQPTTINQLIELLRGVVGPSHPFRVIYEPFRPGEIVNTWCDIAKAQQGLGFEIRTPLDEGLKKTWSWFLG